MLKGDVQSNSRLIWTCQYGFSRSVFRLEDKDIYQFDLLHSRILVGKSKAQNLHIDSRVCGIYPSTHIQFFIYLNKVGPNDRPTQLVPKSHKILRYPNAKDYRKTEKIFGISTIWIND